MASVCSYRRKVREQVHSQYMRAKMNAYSNIKHVHSDTTHILFTSDTFLCRPLECGNTRVLDFVEVLHTLRHIDQQIRASGIGTETPNLPGISDIPTVLISKSTSTELIIVTSSDFAPLNSLREFFVNGQSLYVETIVLVLRF